ncbi:MAG: hypothetical protein O7E54_03260 [Planctomycetota bacterium]|nr:hypothetical protein [Planctomycetota bacterium]
MLEGEFEVPCDGAHELLLHARGGLKVSIGGRTLFEGRDVSDQLFFPLFLKAGWYPIRFELEPRGRPQLVALLGGERVTRPLRLHCDAGAALGAKPQSDNPALTDGKRSGTVVEVSSDGVELTWKKTARGVARIVLFPEPSQLDGPAFPKEWAVDVRGRAGKWAPVDVTVVRAKSARRPPFDRKKEIKPVEVPDYVALLFEPLDARRLRIRPAGKPARLLEIEVYGPLP